MSLFCVACQCGGADGWIRSKLRKFNYPHSLTVPITKGKEKSISFLSTLPQTDEVTDLAAYIKRATKFAIIIGTDGTNVRWIDVANGRWLVNDVTTEFIVRDFGND